LCHCDIRTHPSSNGLVWGIGSFCRETKEYLSEPWECSIYRQAVSERTGERSVPFLETYGVLISVLALGRPGTKIRVYSDCAPAVIAITKRWCKTNQLTNLYIGSFDMICTNNCMYVQVEKISRDDNY